MTTAYEVTGSALVMSAFTTALASGAIDVTCAGDPRFRVRKRLLSGTILVLALFVLPALLLSEAKARGIR